MCKYECKKCSKQYHKIIIGNKIKCPYCKNTETIRYTKLFIFIKFCFICIITYSTNKVDEKIKNFFQVSNWIAFLITFILLMVVSILVYNLVLYILYMGMRKR